MIPSIHIKNFLTFDSLEIPTLKRINLIGGKNNAGKTSLLEVLLILTSNGENRVLNTILKNRGGLDQGSLTTYEELKHKNSLKKNHKFDGKLLDRQQDFIEWMARGVEREEITNRLYRNLSEDTLDKDIKRILFVLGVQNENEAINKWEDTLEVVKINGLLLTEKHGKYKILNKTSERDLSPSREPNLSYEHFSFVPAYTKLANIEKVWNTIVLTEDEDLVLELIRKVIDPRITKLSIGSLGAKTQIDGKPVSIKTLGEGVSRVLLIIISMVAAKNKYLVIDEIETALHYSAQENLWNTIFEYAEKWNIQVFATTHSRDTIRAFKYACTKYSKNGEIDAQYLRLQKSRAGNFEAIDFDYKNLDQSLDLNLEIR